MMSTNEWRLVILGVLGAGTLFCFSMAFFNLGKAKAYQEVKGWVDRL